MFAVEVRAHVMIAHSFRGELFGPAQRLHGATFVIDVAFFRRELTADGVVVDIGRAHDALNETLAPLNYRNLDELAGIRGQADDDGISVASTSSRKWRRPRARDSSAPAARASRKFV